MVELPIYFTLKIQLLANLAFLFMWFADKSKKSLLWWSVAHFGQLAMSALPSLLIELGEDIPPGIALISGFIMAFTSTAFFIAAGYYKAYTRLVKKLFYGGVVFTIVMMGLSLKVDQGFLFMIAVIIICLAFSFTAWVLWDRGFLAKITSVFFAFRAISSFYFVSQADFASYPAGFTTLPSTMFTVILLSVLLLLLTMFQNSQMELKNHIGFLSLTQAFSQVLEGVTDARQAGERLIKLFMERQVWTNAGLFVPDEDNKKLYAIVGAGKDFKAMQKALEEEGLPIDSSLAGRAFTSKKIVCDYDIYNQPVMSKLGFFLKDASRKARTTQVLVPLQHDNTTYGVLIVNRPGYKELSTEEIKIIENIGQVMGLTLANIRHMDALSYRATHDSLTGLSNRSALHEFFKLQSTAKHFVLMLFDLNHFKEVNDTLGHDVGDSMLCALAERLELQLANEETHIFRLGGDEFVVTYELHSDSYRKEQLAEELSRLIAEVIYIEDLALRTTASIGVVESDGRALNSHELLRCADLAMYQAKSQGVAIAYYEQDTDNEVQKRVAVIEGVADAIEKGQLELAFQPIIDLKKAKCVKCEALIRWHHPEQGVISAANFMPTIETTHMISAITRIVARKAMQAAKFWPGIVVSINLSARNLMDEKLVDFLMQEVVRHELNPAMIQFEITETMLMADHVATELVLNRLVKAGFTIALDDFGTGYSSLAYLSRFPIHTLKIDGSFTRKMLHDEGTRSIVESTVELCYKLGLNVVAEGVETTSEAQALVDMGCHSAQGYLYSKPLASAQFSRWLCDYNREPRLNPQPVNLGSV